MKVKCCLCGKLLKEMGALLFSPPYPVIEVENCRYNSWRPDAIVPVTKFHICKPCYKKLYDFMINIAVGRMDWPVKNESKKHRNNL